jgi:hypothetical protein
MKLGDIKAEALRVMFVNAGRDIAADNLVDYVGDNTYGYYLVNMPGAINRAFCMLERARVLPLRSCELIAAAGVETARGVRFDMNVIARDFYDAERLVKESAHSYDATADYMREEDSILIENYDTAAMYRLLYRPSVRRVTMGTPDDYEVEMPDHIAALIPYAVKADLFRDDDPDEAERARKRFEEELAMLSGEVRGSHQGRVKTVYGGGMLL